MGTAAAHEAAATAYGTKEHREIAQAAQVSVARTLRTPQCHFGISSCRSSCGAATKRHLDDASGPGSAWGFPEIGKHLRQ